MNCLKKTVWIMNLTVQKIIGGVSCLVYLYGGLFGAGFLAYIALCTRFWWLALLYCMWAYIIDKGMCERGGRRSEFLRNLPNWKVCAQHFSHRFVPEDGFKLESDKNYIFAFFPHGVLPMGAYTSFIINDYKEKYYPHHTPYMAIVPALFQFPLFRDYILGLGFISASAKSLRWILNKMDGGNILYLSVGGAPEAYHCRPGNYKIYLKNRKGFIKIALETGTHLVPVITFGEIDLFNQIDTEGTFIRKIQETIRKYTGVAPVMPNGSGFFQEYFGLLPKRKPLVTVLGEPIIVEKQLSPSPELIDEVHAKFMDRIKALFENHKHKYIPDFANILLIVE